MTKQGATNGTDGEKDKATSTVMRLQQPHGDQGRRSRHILSLHEGHPEPQAARRKRTAEKPGQGKGPSRGDESSSYRCHSKFERYFPTPLDHVGELTTPLPSASHGGDREKKARGEQKGKREKRKPPSEEEGRLLVQRSTAQSRTVLQKHCTCTAGDG